MNRQHIALIAAALAAPLIVLTSWPTASRDAILKIGGQNLHIETFGASEPTVVFEAGLGNDSTTWKFIAPQSRHSPGWSFTIVPDWAEAFQ